MEKMFEVEAEPARKLIRVVMRGFWTNETVVAYDGEVRRVRRELLASGCGSSEIIVLVDARELGAQAQDVVAAYKQRFSDSGLQPRRLATIVSSPVFKLQVKRIDVPNQQIFVDEDEALAWLFS